MQRFFLIVCLISLLISCSIPKNTTTREFNSESGGFKIDMPAAWVYIKKSGIDSYIGCIYMDKSDTAYFSLGIYAARLERPICTQRLDIDDELVKIKIRKKTINGLNAKIVFHKYNDLNDYGIRFDSLWTENESDVDIKYNTWRDIVKFTIYGKNLSKTSRKQLLQAVNTIKFLKPVNN